MNLIIIGFAFYFIIITAIALSVYYKNKHTAHSNYSHLILGNRSINYITTAFSAHASDMSDWLFMAFPAALYVGGLAKAWIGIGLVVGMYLVWTFIAPQLRIATEKYDCLTLSTYFERRFNDDSGTIRIISSLVSLLFFAVYIAAGLKGFGFLTESLSDLSYHTGIIIAIISVVSYIFIGGYKALALIDCFQAIFLLTIILYVPIVALSHIGGYNAIITAAANANISLALMPHYWTEIINTLLMAFSWAVGYCGTPHILTKFMGMNDVSQMKKAKYIGMFWQITVLCAAGLVGLIGIAYFPATIDNKELIFIEIVKDLFSPLQIGFILSSIAGATLSVITAQLLVLVSTITEDLYHGTLRKNATDNELLWIYRLSIIIIAALSFLVSLNKTSSIQSLVHYAWMGFGSSFGPLVILSLHSHYINKYGACAALITGSITAALWHSLCHTYFITHYSLDIPAVLPGFLLSICSAYILSWISKKN